MHRSRWRGVVLVAVAALLGACGSGSAVDPGPDRPALTGLTAERGMALAAYQAFAATVAYPVRVLEITQPRDANVLLPTAASRAWDPRLGLYSVDPRRTPGGFLLQYFHDAARANSAGRVLITGLPPDKNNDYLSYPVAARAAVEVTGGPLATRGELVVGYTNNRGANQLASFLRLGREAITVRHNLRLNTDHTVGGTASAAVRTALISLDELSGPLAGILTSTVRVDPYNWRGSLRAGVVDGTFELTLTLAPGRQLTARALAGPEPRALALVYSDGTRETIAQPLAAALDGRPPASGTGSVRVTLVPASAVEGGARWTLDDDPQQYVSGATVGDLAVGPHTVRYSAVGGVGTPAPQTVEVRAGETTEVTGNYIVSPPG